MSERRALLDPDMYKISEEDSQDEEVLSAGSPLPITPEDVIKLGNDKYRTSTGGYAPQVMITGSSSLLLATGLSYHQHKSKNSVSSTMFERGSGPHVPSSYHSRGSTSKSLHSQSDNLCWPEAGTSSDSNTSSDTERPTNANKASTKLGISGRSSLDTNSNKTGGKQQIYLISRDAPQGASATGNRYKPAKPRGVTSSVSAQHQKHRQQHAARRKSRKSRTTLVRNNESSSGSSSGSDCSEECNSPCDACGNSREFTREHGDSSSSADLHDDDSHHHRESSNSESSYYEDDVVDGNDASPDDDYSDDNQAAYEEMVKFITDKEIRSNVTEEGELFLLEYDADSSEGWESDVKEQDGDQRLRQRHEESLLQGDHENGNHGQGVIGETTSSISSHDTPDKASAMSLARGKSGQHLPMGLLSDSNGSGNTHFQKSGISTKGKISQLLKRRRDGNQKKSRGSKVSLDDGGRGASSFHSASVGNADVSSDKPPGASPLLSNTKTGKASAAPPEKVFRFKDEHGGETRTVFVDIPQSGKSGNLGRRATLIESILGIIPERFSPPSASSSEPQLLCSTPLNDRIMIAAFVPDGVASRYHRIKIGDWLQSVDDITIGHSNMDQVLSSRLMYGKRKTTIDSEFLRLKLSVRRMAACMVEEPTLKGDRGSSSARTHGTFSSGNNEHWFSSRKFHATMSPRVQNNVVLLFISNVSQSCAITEPPSRNDSSATHNCHSKEKSKEVVFSWPKIVDSTTMKALLASQGMFSTLFRLLRDVTGSSPLLSRITIDDTELDVSYSSDDGGASLLLLAVATSLLTFSDDRPSVSKVNGEAESGGNADRAGVPGERRRKERKIRWSTPHVGGGVTMSSRIMTRFESLLKFQFGSFNRAFKEASSEKISHFLNNSMSALDDLTEDFLFLQAPGNFFRIPYNIQSGIDDTLYYFETSDSLDSLSISRGSRLPNTPVFYCHGSCLMYKGYLVTSHIENELSCFFHGWWKTQLGVWGRNRHLFTEKWERLSRLVLWHKTHVPIKEVRPSGKRRSEDNDELDDDDLSIDNDGLVRRKEPGFRQCFSGLVGVGNFAVGFVLENMTQHHGPTQPDLGWLRRAMTTICRLHYSRLTRNFEGWLQKQDKREGRELVSKISKGSKRPRDLQPATFAKSPARGSILKNADVTSPGAFGRIGSSQFSAASLALPPTTLTVAGKQLNLQSHLVSSSPHMLEDPLVEPGVERGEPAEGSDSDDDDATTATGSDSSSLKWYEIGVDVASGGAGFRTLKADKPMRVTNGNVLYACIQLEFGRGVMLSSSTEMPGGWIEVVWHNFRQSTTLIHEILHKAANVRERLEKCGNDKRWITRALAPISEHGILFNCQITDPRDLHKRKPRKREMYYWVVGRIYSEEREVYICYEDGPMSQQLIEVAYKIALNSH